MGETRGGALNAHTKIKIFLRYIADPDQGYGIEAAFSDITRMNWYLAKRITPIKAKKIYLMFTMKFPVMQ
ncbi:hypothetical protein JTB14_006975 [Gonioctena quinquepunctata]|nr:hypothetical protein JTB14_006975 [Gonioctena quinquepunctata]